ncbi:uncharacterized protein LY89DRAFT_623534 [Mollisia scopiformis]|uniref:Mid2 domain-containing protein n=1 Tax=Mollisia scopiformis TaxID=149040 RepID=A0A194WXG3_MOLSC|nr:uncharacterized protein LY89DRAFT_623534 [Mollisia scopiformis]KUJ12374.1 hypothetical protein LY89DRAFT_623534 [Mollisia scopiformis]
MLCNCYISFLGLIAALSFVRAGIASSHSNLELRNVGLSSEVGLRTPTAKFKRDTVIKNSTTLDKSWNGATLFSLQLKASGESKRNTDVTAGINIVCTTCYIKGTATAQLTISDNFNLTQAFESFKSAVEYDIGTVTNVTVNDFETYFDNLESDITSLNFAKFESDLTFPTANNTDFDLEIPDIPQATLLFQFDGLELYMDIDTTLSDEATYTVNIYKSKTALGVSAGEESLGIIFSIDLILSVDSSIDISSGFHIKLNDGVAIDLALFSQNVSSITMNGGNFEFLPVTIESAGVQLTALLKVGIQAGLNVAAPPFKLDGVKFDTFSAGAAVGVYMNVAEFITNVTANPAGNVTGCEVLVEEVYSMAIGAQAGATLALNDYSWGPTPNTSTAVFYTTLASRCALSSATSAALTARAAQATGLTTTTLTTSDTYTATQCLSTGLLNCPISMQTTSKQTVTSTLVTSVPSGSTATFPTTIQNSVANTIAFGTNVKALTSTSGTPTSFNPTSTPTGITGVIDGKIGGVSNKLIIGVSVGIGVPFLVGVIAGCFFFAGRRRSETRGNVSYADAQGLSTSEPYTPSQMSVKKMPNVVVSENLR